MRSVSYGLFGLSLLTLLAGSFVCTKNQFVCTIDGAVSRLKTGSEDPREWDKTCAANKRVCGGAAGGQALVLAGIAAYLRKSSKS